LTRQLASTVSGVETRSHPEGRSTLDPDSDAWLAALRSSDGRREEAFGRLHALLLRAARFEVNRRRSSLAYLGEEELEALALHAADDALMAVLGKLDDYRGTSRFTTWAYKFALFEAATKVQRRRMWRRDLPLDPEQWESRLARQLSTHDQAELDSLLEALEPTIRTALTPHQRRVLVALAIDGVPIDVLADRLSTTRGALYKALHDARRKLRAALTDQGFDLASTLGED
jgi:RNA polymerase sigma-70 factor (ECF subfamily)